MCMYVCIVQSKLTNDLQLVHAQNFVKKNFDEMIVYS